VKKGDASIALAAAGERLACHGAASAIVFRVTVRKRLTLPVIGITQPV